MRRFWRYRSAARWLVLLAGLASLAVAVAGLVPHHDEGQDCLVCKVRQQPLQQITVAVVLEAPPLGDFRTPADDVHDLQTFVAESASPRAPPA